MRRGVLIAGFYFLNVSGEGIFADARGKSLDNLAIFFYYLLRVVQLS